MSIHVSPQVLSNLQDDTHNIRNICIIAHVDHGKTTLSDSLISSNGIISEKLAGKIRYLDSTEEEQIRGITMKSSAISLLYNSNTPSKSVDSVHSESSKSNEQTMETVPYLINLIDSPGHIDFSFDVSTAVRLCDGALVVVDVVEGVCAQTHSVLRQAWQERVRPCLVLNKMDRLISELRYTPLEAYEHICRILEQVNVIISSMITADFLQREDEEREKEEEWRRKNRSRSRSRTLSQDISSKTEYELYNDWHVDVETTRKKEATMFFSPIAGNVVFASAVDGFAFGIGYFANIFSKKLNLPFGLVRKSLWGTNAYYNPSTKSIVSKPPKVSSVPMFVEFVLKPIWSVYDASQLNPNPERLQQILRSLRLAKVITSREKNHADRRVTTQAIMKKWLPLSSAILRMVVRVLPSPIAAQESRVDSLWPPSLIHNVIKNEEETKEPAESSIVPKLWSVKQSIRECDSEMDAPMIAYISKMISIERRNLSDGGGYNGYEDDNNKEVLVSFARIYSGCLRTDQNLYVLGPKHVPKSNEEDMIMTHASIVPVNQLKLYMFMGRELVRLNHVPCGNVVGIVGLDNHVLKTATLSSTLHCPSLSKMPYQARPIMRVAVEPEDPRQFKQLEKGLQLLNRADPTVEVKVQETGEHVIIALGELHLECCIKDLRDRFAQIPIRVSSPIVGFRETIVDGTISTAQFNAILTQSVGLENTNSDQSAHNSANDVKNQFDVNATPMNIKSVELYTPNNLVSIRLRAIPLPICIAKYLETKGEAIKRLYEGESGEKLEISQQIVQQLENLLKVEGEFWRKLDTNQIWSCGPRRVGSNVLINNIQGLEDINTPTFMAANLPNNEFNLEENVVESLDSISLNDENERKRMLKRMESSIVTGFQLASTAGPLCQEPIWGVAFVVEDFQLHTQNLNDESSKDEEMNISNNIEHNDPYGPISGQIISVMQKACRQAFLLNPVRLVEAVYLCTVQCQAEQLGKLYGVISKRRGTVLQEELSDGTSLFTIVAHLPVVESFGLTQDLLSQTSGSASNPQLSFSEWQLLEMDPYFQPVTEEEREEHGERVFEQNIVRKYIDGIRRRKGLALDQKIVIHAEKQRTLTRNK